jgi:hypothetical protein
MIRKIVNWVILLVIAAGVVALAVANRQNVIVNLDPLGLTSPPLTTSPRVWLLALIMVVVGVIVGGVAVWMRQGRWRRSARALDREARALRAENLELKRRLDAAETTVASSGARRIAPPAAA